MRHHNIILMMCFSCFLKSDVKNFNIERKNLCSALKDFIFCSELNFQIALNSSKTVILCSIAEIFQYDLILSLKHCSP